MAPPRICRIVVRTVDGRSRVACNSGGYESFRGAQIKYSIKRLSRLGRRNRTGEQNGRREEEKNAAIKLPARADIIPTSLGCRRVRSGPQQAARNLSAGRPGRFSRGFSGKRAFSRSFEPGPMENRCSTLRISRENQPPPPAHDPTGSLSRFTVICSGRKV